MSVSDKLLLRKRAIIETVNDELKNIAQVEHSRHRSFGNFVVNLLGGILHTATSQRNLPYEYRPLICQMTDSLLYSKVYFVELTLFYYIWGLKVNNCLSLFCLAAKSEKGSWSICSAVTPTSLSVFAMQNFSRSKALLCNGCWL